jgi:hypothetical protein
VQTNRLLGLIGEINVTTREHRDESDARISALETKCAELAEQLREAREVIEALVYNLHESAKK